MGDSRIEWIRAQLGEIDVVRIFDTELTSAKILSFEGSSDRTRFVTVTSDESLALLKRRWLIASPGTAWYKSAEMRSDYYLGF